MPCPIWGTSANEQPRTGGFVVLDSPRAGGLYGYTDSVSNELPELSTDHKMAVTRWLCSRRAMGTEIPRLDSYNLPVAKSARPLRFSEKLNSALINLSAGLRRLDKGFEIQGRSNGDVLKLIAFTDSHDFAELIHLLRTARELGLLSDTGSHAQLLVFTPAAAGWERIEHLQTREQQSSQAFVAMWFSETMDGAFLQGFEPAITRAGYRPMRIDKKEHVNKVDDEIISEIRRSRFLVSDFTCEPAKVRGGVYFEAGFAMGLDIPVIWTVHASSIEDLHFDTRQYNHIVWDTPSDLYAKLLARIGAIIGDGPLVVI